jgi:hypothetical protein
MHALLWRPPFMNGAVRDEGWMCREHALITAGIGALLGFRAALSWGSVALIGQVAGDTPAGMLLISKHSWCMYEGGGVFDLSLNLQPRGGPGWSLWPGHLLAGDGFYPGKKIEFRLFAADDYQHFLHAVQLSQETTVGNPRGFFAYYHGREIAWLAADYVAEAPSYINSPLTDDLKMLSTFTPEIYAKAIRHCWDILNRRTRSLAEHPQIDAWRIISQVEEGAVDWLVRAAALPATARSSV